MRFLNAVARHSGDKASSFIVLAFVMLAGRELRGQAEGHDTPTRNPPIAASSDALGGSQLLREIDDPNSGARWLLVRDKSIPGGPGRLELVSARKDPGGAGGQAKAPLVTQARPEPIIRAGDKLVVEEHSVTTDAYLEGVALGPAGPGSDLNVRLSIGGKVVRALATAPGRATLQGVRR